jgi:hypothetical protein
MTAVDDGGAALHACRRPIEVLSRTIEEHRALVDRADEPQRRLAQLTSTELTCAPQTRPSPCQTSAWSDLVETMGIEPTTPCLQSRCSAN